jgi:putative ABC transport system permease protein
MSWWHELYGRVVDALRWGRLERDMDEELRFHIRMRTQDNIDRGLAPDEARRVAERRFGNLTLIKESCRESQGRLIVENLQQDIRFGARMLARNPLFTSVAVFTLALGIGANTAIFSVVDAVLLRPLPYDEPERIVVVWERFAFGTRPRNMVSPANFLDWREQATSFEHMTAFREARMNLTGSGEPEEVAVQRATAEVFATLGVDTALGRAFSPEDGAPGAPPVAVLSHGFWQRRFGGDAGLIGKTVELDGNAFTVVGVLPPNFRWSVQVVSGASLAGRSADVWIPITNRLDGLTQRGRNIGVVARLKPNVMPEQARAEMTEIAARLERQYPEFNAGAGVAMYSLREQLTGDVRPALLVLLAAVVLVLLIACANVANLMMARAAARKREIAVRSALGAARLRIVRQMLTESVLLALLGGSLGLALAYGALEALVAVSPANLLTASDVGLDATMLGFTLAVSLATAVLFGLVPALEASRVNPQESLQAANKGAGGTPRNRRVRNVFVAAEVATALVLLVGAGLLVQSLLALRAVDPGFDSDDVLTVRVKLPAAKYPEDAQVVSFFNRAVDRVEALPGVRAVGAVQYLPFAGPGASTDFTIEGRPAPAPGEPLLTDVLVVDDGYFRAMRIDVVAGREFSAQEIVEARHVAVVNESLARRYFPGEDPIGKRVTVQMAEDPVPTEIVGVVKDTKFLALTEDAPPTVYVGHAELPYSLMTLVIRTQTEPLSLAPAVRREIYAIDEDQPVGDVRTLEAWLASSVAQSRFNTLLLSVFAAVALLLAAVGIYGVMAYSVAQRTQEIGIRMALGARARDVLALVVRQGMTVTLVGIAVGLATAFLLARTISSLLYGVSVSDPLTYLAISTLLAGVALVANAVPAWRATRVDPNAALRSE